MQLRSTIQFWCIVGQAQVTQIPTDVFMGGTPFLDDRRQQAVAEAVRWRHEAEGDAGVLILIVAIPVALADRTSSDIYSAFYKP